MITPTDNDELVGVTELSELYCGLCGGVRRQRWSVGPGYNQDDKVPICNSCSFAVSYPKFKGPIQAFWQRTFFHTYTPAFEQMVEEQAEQFHSIYVRYDGRWELKEDIAFWQELDKNK